jgi:hypothetical protein
MALKQRRQTREEAVPGTAYDDYPNDGISTVDSQRDRHGDDRHSLQRKDPKSQPRRFVDCGQRMCRQPADILGLPLPDYRPTSPGRRSGNGRSPAALTLNLQAILRSSSSFASRSCFSASSKNPAFKAGGGGDRDQGAQPRRLTFMMIAKLRSSHWTVIRLVGCVFERDPSSPVPSNQVSKLAASLSH